MLEKNNCVCDLAKSPSLWLNIPHQEKHYIEATLWFVTFEFDYTELIRNETSDSKFAQRLPTADVFDFFSN